MLRATEGLKISVNLNPFGFVAARDSNCIFKQYIAKEKLRSKVCIFFVMSACKNQYKFQNTNQHSNLDYFFMQRHDEKKRLLNLGLL